MKIPARGNEGHRARDLVAVYRNGAGEKRLRTAVNRAGIPASIQAMASSGRNSGRQGAEPGSPRGPVGAPASTHAISP